MPPFGLPFINLGIQQLACDPKIRIKQIILYMGAAILVIPESCDNHMTSCLKSGIVCSGRYIEYLEMSFTERRNIAANLYEAFQLIKGLFD